MYYEKSKKARSKLKGLKKAIQDTEKKVKQLESKADDVERSNTAKMVKRRKKEWYEAFHWFFSSDGYLVVAGRDAKSNETIVKKKMEKGDVYFHADIVGAPHTIVKSTGNTAPEKTLEETAIFAASFSKAWREKLSSLDVYSVNPEQVSKKAPSGESLGTGAFMIYGKRQWFKKTPLKLSIGVMKEKNVVMCAPKSAVQKNCLFSVDVLQGNDKKGAAAKQIRKILESKLGGIKLDLDEIITVLPAGGIKVANK